MEKIPNTLVNQPVLARASGVSASMISHIRAGRKKPSLRVQFAIWGDTTLINDRPLTEWREVMKEARLEQGMTQKQLADASGYNQPLSIIRIENGITKTITLDKFKKLINALNIKGLPEDEHSTIQVQDETTSEGSTTECGDAESGRDNTESEISRAEIQG